MYKDNEVLPSAFKPGQFDKTERMYIYTFPAGLADYYHQYFDNEYSRSYPKLPNPLPSFERFYHSLSADTKSQISIRDLEQSPVVYFDPMNEILKTRLRQNWESILPEIGQRPDGFNEHGRPKYIQRIQEAGVIYEGDADFVSSVRTYYEQQIFRNNRVFHEDRPSMKEWYDQLGAFDKVVLKKVTRKQIHQTAENI